MQLVVNLIIKHGSENITIQDSIFIPDDKLKAGDFHHNKNRLKMEKEFLFQDLFSKWWTEHVKVKTRLIRDKGKRVKGVS